MLLAATVAQTLETHGSVDGLAASTFLKKWVKTSSGRQEEYIPKPAHTNNQHNNNDTSIYAYNLCKSKVLGKC